MKETVQNKNKRAKAVWLQRAANALSYSRILAAPLLFTHIARGSHMSWKTTGVIGLLAIGDGLDGHLARKAAEIDSNVANERGAWLDQMADKALTHSILGGLAVHALRSGKSIQGSALLANQLVQCTRDTWVTHVRKEAAAHNIPTKAQKLGKIKTGVLLGSLATLASPIAKNTIGEQVGIAGVTVGSGLAIASGLSLVNNLHEGIKVARQTEESAYLPTLTVDTTSPTA